MRYLHTMIRVTNLEKSLDFYQKGMGFELVSRRDYEKDRFTLAFLHAPGDTPEPGKRSPLIELTWNWDTTSYTRGDAFGHLGFAVDSIDEIQKQLRAHGYDLSWGPGLTPNGKTKMAFVDDPDGYEIELLEVLA